MGIGACDILTVVQKNLVPMLKIITPTMDAYCTTVQGFQNVL